MSSDSLQQYIELLQRYVAGKLDDSSFEQQYLALTKHYSGNLSFEEYNILQDLFYVVESYCPDPGLRGEEDADEQEMREAAAVALNRLEEHLKA